MNADNGVIVFRTGRSRRGPHRVKPTLKCPIRRDERCEALSMREIQDMPLNLSRGTEQLERRLRERSRKFGKEFKRLQTPDDAFRFRMTAVPVGDEIHFGSVYSGGDLVEELHPPPSPHSGNGAAFFGAGSAIPHNACTPVARHRLSLRSSMHGQVGQHRRIR